MKLKAQPYLKLQLGSMNARSFQDETIPNIVTSIRTSRTKQNISAMHYRGIKPLNRIGPVPGSEYIIYTC